MPSNSGSPTVGVQLTYSSDTMVRSESGTVVVNSEANTLVDSELGTMVINDTDDEESTMKRM